MAFTDYVNKHWQELVNLGYSIVITEDHSKKKEQSSKVHFYLNNRLGRRLNGPYAYLNRFSIRMKHLITALPGTTEDRVVQSLLEQVLLRHQRFYTEFQPKLAGLQRCSSDNQDFHIEVYRANSPDKKNKEYSYRLYLVDQHQNRILNGNATTLFTHHQKLTSIDFQKSVEATSPLGKALIRLLDIYEAHHYELDEWEEDTSRSNIINRKRIKV
ncbi:MAG TPA: hypothetical protein VM577_03710 [Anaerovoracaceae bacterium]|nr:hypothetical protein [Anaerovoracaceae bacterium]